MVHFAAAEGHGEVLGKLVDAGASVSDEDKDGMNAVMHAGRLFVEPFEGTKINYDHCSVSSFSSS